MTDEQFLDDLSSRGARIRRAKSGKLHTLDARPIANALTEQELKRVAALSDLRHLELDGAAVTDDIVGEMIQLQSIQHLDLQNTDVTDASLETFAELPKLQFLLLTGSQATKAGVDTLRKRLINTRVVFLTT